MWHLVRSFILFLSPLLLCGSCYQIDQVITLNPDRSAKVRITLTLDSPGLVGAGFLLPEDIDAMGIGEIEQMMEQSVDGLRRASEGVEAWSPFKQERLADGTLRMSGTAYVPDIARYRLGDPNDDEFPSFLFDFTESEEGRARIEASVRGVTDWEADEKWFPDYTDDQLQEMKNRLAERRQEFREQEQEMKEYLRLLKLTTLFRVDGPIEEVHNFTKDSPNEARLVLEGIRLYHTFAKVLNDEELSDQMIRNGYQFEDDQITLPAPVVNETLFSEKAPATLTFKQGSRGLFDYEREIAKLKADAAHRES